MSNESKSVALIEYKKFKHATLYCFENYPHTGLIQADSTYIPIEQFKEIFHSMEELIQERGITRLIFDKRKLSVFHQPSMEWYFVEWKEKMTHYGLKHHIKILPDDNVFCQSVKLGRDQINKKYPHAKFHELTIEYASSIEEAVTK